MLPILIGIFIWWVPDITKLFCNKSCDMPFQEKNETIRDVLHEIISKQDIERLITAAIIMGVQKFAKTHPKEKTIFNDLFKIIKQTKK